MTQEEIISMARNAGAATGKPAPNAPEIVFTQCLDIYHFAKLVAEKEREEIAEFIESTNLGSLPEQTALHYANLLRSYSTAIRARGQQ